LGIADFMNAQHELTINPTASTLHLLQPEHKAKEKGPHTRRGPSSGRKSPKDLQRIEGVSPHAACPFKAVTMKENLTRQGLIDQNQPFATKSK
jgi:hypothetical protein